MTIRQPHSEQVFQLRQLWKEVFGDTDAFLDSFFSIAYCPDRCLCAMEEDVLAGMLYWLPCGKDAYLYAVATHPDHRGNGICRSLMEAAHEAIARQGYEGVLLYPQEEGLRTMYRKMGYDRETFLAEQHFTAGGAPVAVTRISCEEYFSLRERFLPAGAVIQSGPFPELLEPLSFFGGENFLLAAEDRGDTLFGCELLGDPGLASGILAALGKSIGRFRFPGSGTPFAMYHPLKEDAQTPTYFAFPLD